MLLLINQSVLLLVIGDTSRTFSGEWNLEKELAASEDVGELRLELGKDEDKLFAEVSDVFGQDDSVNSSLHLDEDAHQHEENSPTNQIIEDEDDTEVVTLS